MGLLIAVALAAALVVATRREAAVECTVCMAFGGREACRAAAGPDRESAERGATSSACAILASGMTLALECDRTPPHSVRCSE